VAVVDAFESGVEFPLEVPGDALTEDLRDLFGGQFKEAELAGAFKEFVNGEGIAERQSSGNIRPGRRHRTGPDL